MTALYIILGVIAFIALILFSRVGIHIIYESGDAKLFITFGFLRYGLLPEKEKEPKYKKNAKKLKGKKLSEMKEKKKKQDTHKTEKKVKFNRTGDTVDNIISAIAEKTDDPETVKLLLTAMRELAKDFKKILQIKLSEFYIKIDNGDAASTAIACGGLSGALSVTLELLNSVTQLSVPHPEKIGIIPAFDGSGNDFSINLKIRMRVVDLIFDVVKSIIKSKTKLSTQVKG